MYTKLKTFNH